MIKWIKRWLSRRPVDYGLPKTNTKTAMPKTAMPKVENVFYPVDESLVSYSQKYMKECQNITPAMDIEPGANDGNLATMLKACMESESGIVTGTVNDDGELVVKEHESIQN